MNPADILIILFFLLVLCWLVYQTTKFNQEDSVQVLVEKQLLASDQYGDAFEILDKQLDAFLGKRIKQVKYILVNYPEQPFQHANFDLFDQAIEIEFHNGKFLSWVWTENRPIVGYHLFFEAITPHHTTSSEIKYAGKRWEALYGSKVLNLRLERSTNLKSLTDLHIYTEEEHIRICATHEPDTEQLDAFKDIPVGADWGVVLFEPASFNRLT